MIKINIKPLSVNDAYQGQRFKSNEYKQYTYDVLLLLPKSIMPDPPYMVYYEFGLSNVLADWDNPVKPFQDLLQQKYGFSDRHIMRAIIDKVKVERGKEYIKFDIITYNGKRGL